MIEIMDKIDDVLMVIDNSDNIKRLKELKKIMDADPKIKQLLASFSVAKANYERDSSTIQELTKSKTELYNHPIVFEYRKLYNEVNLSFIKFSKEISSLTKTKNPTCSRI